MTDAPVVMSFTPLQVSVLGMALSVFIEGDHLTLTHEQRVFANGVASGLLDRIEATQREAGFL